MKVFIHHGPKRATTVADLKQYDVVLTTYGTLTSESPSDVSYTWESYPTICANLQATETIQKQGQVS